jgi:hypothetical protein
MESAAQHLAFGKTMKYRFEQYTLQTGRTNDHNLPYAALEEFI